jgi:cytochrome c peroxidase
MHDGRFATLEEVVEHYIGVQMSATLDNRLRTQGAKSG